MKNFSLKNMQWFCAPKAFEIAENSVRMITEPRTDFWQRTHYGFQHDNAHFLYHETTVSSFSFTVKTTFHYQHLYDQCGLVVYANSDHWFKACIEYHHENALWLGSVVTQNGYSDWASSDLEGSLHEAWYRVSRQDADYLIEYSQDGKNFRQMRLFHFAQSTEKIKIGLMAASPSESMFEAVFSDISMGESLWEAHLP